MASITNIDWTDATWNPWIGCTKVSPGCANCYAEKMSHRRKWAVWGPGKTREKTQTWRDPVKWNKHTPGKKVFVASLADVFDAEVDPAWLGEVLDVIKSCPKLTFQVLTKRIDEAAQRLPDLIAARGGWGEFKHLWLGTSAENQQYWDKRVPTLLSIPAAKRFVSVEPMVGEIDPHGPRFRKIDENWIRKLRDYSFTNKIPFFFKQWGGISPKKHGKVIDGCTWCQIP